MLMRWAIRALSLTALLFAMLTAASLPSSAQVDPCSPGGDLSKCKGAGVAPNPFEKIPRSVGEAKRLSHGIIYIGGALDSDEFQTYSIFLIPGRQWAQHNSQELDRLEGVYKKFAEKIGEQHLAIWFSTRGLIHDFCRDQEFCRNKFNLSISGGPYVVMMRKHPDDLKQTDQVLTIQLNDINATRVMNVLEVLGEDLQLGHTPHAQAIELERLLQIFLSAKERNGLTGIVIALFAPSSNREEKPCE